MEDEMKEEIIEEVKDEPYSDGSGEDIANLETKEVVVGETNPMDLEEINKETMANGE